MKITLDLKNKTVIFNEISSLKNYSALGKILNNPDEWYVINESVEPEKSCTCQKNSLNKVNNDYVISCPPSNTYFSLSKGITRKKEYDKQHLNSQ